MTKGRGTVAIASVAIVVAAGAGYLAGRSTGNSGVAGPRAEAESAQTARKILYYRNPMGLADTSPTPKKDAMGMDYIPVHEGEQDERTAAGQIRISVDKVQKLGVRVEPAAYTELERVVSVAGRIELDERRIHAVAPKFEGYVERLRVDATGQQVVKGQPLFEVYSPELVSAQREYALAAQGVESLKEAASEVRDGMRQLAEASLARLRNWDVSEEQVKALSRSGEARRTLTLRSPVAGVVIEKKAVQGMRFMPGEMLYQIADLSSVWVIADVFEQDIGAVAVGARATVGVDANPGKSFAGRVAYVYPTLKAETRSVPVRIELSNPGALLKPGMYARVELRSTGKGKALTIPASAVIDSGTRTVVLVRSGEDATEGRFEPRAARLGLRAGDRVEVLEGVSEGESVVVAANFLIDAESNLKAAIAGFGHAGHGKAAGGTAKAVVAAGHRASGKVEAADVKAGTVSIAHGPVADLKWPAMTMEFKVANAALMQALAPGAEIDFEFVERAPGEWLITQVTATRARAAHAGH